MNPFEILMGHKGKKSYEWQCKGCSRYFPRSCLVYLHSKFEEIEGKYCDHCIHKAYQKNKEYSDLRMSTELFCEGCGQEFPISHLYKNSVFDDSLFCYRCVKVEGDADE